MKTYNIKTRHDIYIDNYKEGQGEHANFFDMEDKIIAETPRQAIEKYFEDILYYSFSFENANIAHEEDEDEPKNTLNYSVLVNEDNSEANEMQKKEWKKNKIKLYSNNIHLTITQLIEVTI